MLRSSLLLEVECRLDPRKYTEEKFIRSTHGKVSPAAISAAALVMLRDDLRTEHQTRLISSIQSALLDLISAGQLAHDVEEWKEDLSSREMTYFLSTCAETKRWLEEEWPSEDEVAEYIFESRNDVIHFSKAERWFTCAKDAVDVPGTMEGLNIDFVNWSAYIDFYIDHSAKFVQKTKRWHIRRAILGLTDSV